MTSRMSTAETFDNTWNFSSTPPIAVHYYVYKQLTTYERELFTENYSIDLTSGICPSWLLLTAPLGSSWKELNEVIQNAAKRARYVENEYSKIQLFSPVVFDKQS